MRSRDIHLIGLLVLCGSTAVYAQPVEPDAPKPKATPAEIDNWVRQLSADRFAERELATQQLIDAGDVVIDAVVKAVQGDEPVGTLG